jgi:hypothetical protein
LTFADFSNRAVNLINLLNADKLRHFSFSFSCFALPRRSRRHICSSHCVRSRLWTPFVERDWRRVAHTVVVVSVVVVWAAAAGGGERVMYCVCVCVWVHPYLSAHSPILHINPTHISRRQRRQCQRWKRRWWGLPLRDITMLRLHHVASSCH